MDGIEPGGGAGAGGGEGEGEGGPLGIDADRVRQLLARGMAMSVALDLWRSSGIWVMGRTDPDYPRLWERRLKASRPPLLFGVGPRELLNAKAVAVVGSREVDEAGTAFAGEVARWCARESLVVASGGARGVDRTAMLAAIDAGGAATGILAGALGREAVSGWCREALRNGRLALVSPYGPDARFTVGGAMGRNRLIYCMADLAVVVSAAEGEGGTWAGATETLKHGWVPLAVRSGDGIPAGNRALLAKGAIEFSFEGAMEVLRGAKVGEPAGVTDSVTTASSAAVPTAATAAMPT